jgi:hypothetical protein
MRATNVGDGTAAAVVAAGVAARIAGARVAMIGYNNRSKKIIVIYTMPPKKLKGGSIISWIKSHPKLSAGAAIIGGILTHDVRQLLRGGRRGKYKPVGVRVKRKRKIVYNFTQPKSRRQ